MLCRRASNPGDARAMAWRQISPPGQNELTQFDAASHADIGNLERQLSELRTSQQAELAQVKQSAFQQGLEQGRAEAASAIRDSAQKLATTLAELVAFRRKLRSDGEMEVVKLSLAVARRILNRELATDPDALEGIVHAALSKLQNRDIWQIRVSPQGAETTTAYIDRAGFGGTVKVVVDPTLQAGDLLVDTPAGELDASINTQLQEIDRGFAERLAMR
jgi:flagellar assembly protein FliH